MANTIGGISRLVGEAVVQAKTAQTQSVGSAIGVRPVGASATGEVVGTFASALKKAVNEVGDKQVRADELIQSLSTGKVKDVHEVMAAVEEAGLAMQLTLQLRNKAIEAYQEIMRMQV